MLLSLDPSFTKDKTAEFYMDAVSFRGSDVITEEAFLHAARLHDLLAYTPVVLDTMIDADGGGDAAGIGADNDNGGGGARPSTAGTQKLHAIAASFEHLQAAWDEHYVEVASLLTPASELPPAAKTNLSEVVQHLERLIRGSSDVDAAWLCFRMLMADIERYVRSKGEGGGGGAGDQEAEVATDEAGGTGGRAAAAAAAMLAGAGDNGSAQGTSAGGQQAILDEEEENVTVEAGTVGESEGKEGGAEEGKGGGQGAVDDRSIGEEEEEMVMDPGLGGDTNDQPSQTFQVSVSLALMVNRVKHRLHSGE